METTETQLAKRLDVIERHLGMIAQPVGTDPVRDPAAALMRALHAERRNVKVIGLMITSDDRDVAYERVRAEVLLEAEDEYEMDFVFLCDDDLEFAGEGVAFPKTLPDASTVAWRAYVGRITSIVFGVNS